ncbi:MAG: HAD-IIIA family hydrolase [Planctomycetes bacterium]|nr:HAD-IIIA family hydrolase [Planctomycetota bacterium]
MRDDFDATLRAVDAARARGARIGFTCGVFDLLHVGHLRYLQAAREHCDFLIVAVNSDASTRRLKGEGHPVLPFAERTELLEGLTAVDLVCGLDDDRPAQLIERLKPDVYLKGGDYRPVSLRSGQGIVDRGGCVLCLDVQTTRSSTEIRQAILTAAQIDYGRVRPRAPAPGLLVDRDGTLIEDRPYLDDVAAVRPLDRAFETLASLQARFGARVAIVSNQPGLGLGLIERERHLSVWSRVLGLAHEAGLMVDRIYVCPHSLARACDCRKPRPELLQRAVTELNLEPSRSVFVGDRATDLAAAAAAGLAGFLVPSEGWSAIESDLQLTMS